MALYIVTLDVKIGGVVEAIVEADNGRQAILKTMNEYPMEYHILNVFVKETDIRKIIK